MTDRFWTCLTTRGIRDSTFILYSGRSRSVAITCGQQPQQCVQSGSTLLG
jgi:hypothetical protein